MVFSPFSKKTFRRKQLINRKKVYVVPHSHWDREWYFTIEDSNVLLSYNMEYLIELLLKNNEFKSYTFDGQLSVVEEYLNIHPEDRSRLKDLIKEKRIFIGPWYTQTDSLLVNKESIIRNLLYGTRLGDSFGHFMKIGYMPDIFGQNQYLPSIFNGFDIKDCIFQRGVYTEELKGNLNFKWSSPDGKNVRANNIFFGYGPGKFLSSEDSYIENKLMPMLEKLESLNKDTDNILLPAGGDQVLPKEYFPKIVKELNKKQDKYEFILSDYETFMEDTWKNNFDNKIAGELTACQQSRIHTTIKSHRYDIKRANYDIENKILYILEPLAVIGKSLGLKYPSSWLDKIWKLLFDVHAHDSIGGCNSDDTNKNIISRLVKADRISSDLINIVKKQITDAVSNKIGQDNIVMLFNTKPVCIQENMEAVIFTNKPDFILQELKGKTAEFDLIKQEHLCGGKQVQVTAEGEKEIKLPGYYRSEIIIKSMEVPSLGYKTLLVRDGKISKENILVTVKREEIENSFYKIKAENNRVSLINKFTGRVIDNFLCFEETVDNGDSYDYSPLPEDEKIIIDKPDLIEVKKSSNIQNMTLVHREINKRNETLIIRTFIQLRDNESFIRVKHEINNKSKNHRLRVILKTDVISKTSLSDEGFSLIERSNNNSYLKDWKQLGFAEAPVPIYAMENMTALRDKVNLYGIISKGIKEYEIIEDSKIALTLFRSVGFLGKDNLEWRPGRASGINDKTVYVKDAQMMKKMEFEYSINLMKSTQGETELFKNMDKYIDRYTVYQKQKLNLYEERLGRFEIPFNFINAEPEYSLLGISNPDVIESACKEAYEKDGVILRLFNPGNKPEKFRINSKLLKSIRITNLYERELENSNDYITIAAKGYVTIKIK